jgi:Ni2+-binding GTPase involved in maturation of urease and hydrogenase
MDKNDIIERGEFEKLLSDRVKKLNKELELLHSQSKEEQNYKTWYGNTIGEA